MDILHVKGHIRMPVTVELEEAQPLSLRVLQAVEEDEESSEEDSEVSSASSHSKKLSPDLS